MAITGNAADRGKFKTPSLRNIALTAPYMHDGRFATLEGHIGRLADNVKALSDRMDSHFRITYWILGILAAALVGLAWRLLK